MGPVASWSGSSGLVGRAPRSAVTTSTACPRAVSARHSAAACAEDPLGTGGNTLVNVQIRRRPSVGMASSDPCGGGTDRVYNSGLLDEISRAPMKRFAIALVSLTVVSSCSRTKESGLQIAFFTKNQTNPFFQTVRMGADNAAKQLGVTVVHYIPTKPDSIPEQMSQAEDV